MFSYFKQDIKSSIVLFLVALPLCLGVALACKTPIIAGVIAGIIGGVVVGILSGSHTSVSGPAAGLTIIVLTGIKDLPSYEAFLLAVSLAGIFQFILGKIRAGALGDFIPGAVISGIMVAIGLLLILKQIPHALGIDGVFEGDEEFLQQDGKNTFTEIYYAVTHVNPGALFIAILSLLILLFWEKLFGKFNFPKYIPSQLIVVLFGVIMNLIYTAYFPSYLLEGYHLSDVPKFDRDTIDNWAFPDFSQIVNWEVWKLAITLAFVASIETLVCIQAGDKMDPEKRITPSNKELRVQGIGNFLSGLVGGLPITAVIVRTSANVHAGARTKWSTVFHGILLFLSIIFLTKYLNMIPKACLAAILIHVGFKLSRLQISRDEYKRKINRFVPFVITIIAILFSDLLFGIIIGIVSSLCFILASNYKTSIMLYKDHDNYLLRFNKDVSFLNKKVLKTSLNSIPPGSNLLIDSTKADFVDIDIIEIIDDFIDAAKKRGIVIAVKTTTIKPESLFKKI